MSCLTYGDRNKKENKQIMVRRLSDRISIEIDAIIRKNKEKADCVIKNISEEYISLETSSSWNKY